MISKNARRSRRYFASAGANAAMKQTCWMICFSMALASVFVSSTRASSVYDANADFTAGSTNPNSVWTYGYTAILGGSFITHGEYYTDSVGFAWRTNLSSGAPAFNHFNVGGIAGALAGETTLHPGPNNEYAVLRFTTPVAGSYDVVASWRGPGDFGETDLQLLLNSNTGSPLGFTNSTTLSGTIQLSSMLLNVGDTIDLSVGTLGNFLSDNTPVNLTITQSIPEPSGLLLSCLAMLFFLPKIAARGH
jgi:hypothetical protein